MYHNGNHSAYKLPLENESVTWRIRQLKGTMIDTGSKNHIIIAFDFNFMHAL